MKPIPSWYRLIKTGCLLALASSALASDFTVTSTADSAALTPGTLRWALSQSNSAGGSNQILFQVPDSSSILTVQELPALTTSVVINSAPAMGTAPEGLSVGKSFAPDTYDILTITSGDCTLRNIVFKDGDISVGASSNLIFNFTDDGTFPDIIKGAGNIIKRGSGNVTLEGANTWTGSTTVEEGRLRINTTSLPGNATVQASARLAFIDAGGGPETYSGTISGAGVLVKEDTHDLTLDGTISHTGGTEIEGGRLIVDPATFVSPTTISGGATLQLKSDSATTVTFSSNVTGSGSLEKEGTSTVALAGANSFTGGINILAGNLRGPVASLPGDISIAAGSMLTFTETGTATFGGIISGDGSVDVNGSGTTVFSEIHTYTGGTTVTSGTLQLDAQLVGDATVATGATLSGLGGVAGMVNAAGFVAPGPGTGTATIGGDLTIEATGGLSVVIQADGTNSAVDVTGLTTIQGGTVSVSPVPGDYSAPITYDILFASGGFDAVDDEFATVNDNLAFIDISVETLVGDGVVRLTAEQNLSTLSDYATAPNQQSVANATEQLCTVNGVDDIDAICNNLGVLTIDQVEPALCALSPEGLGGLLHARLIGSMRTCERITARFSRVHDTHPEARYQQRRGFSWPRGRQQAAWGEGFFIEDCLFNDGKHCDDEHSRIIGLVGGWDVLSVGHSSRNSSLWTLGAAGSYTFSSSCFEELRTELYSHGLIGAIYGSYQYNDFYAGMLAQAGYHFMNSCREIRFASLSRQTEGCFHGYEGALCGESGWRLRLGQFLRLQPSAGLYWGSFRQKAFEEKGAKALNFEVDKVNLSTLVGNARVRFGAEWDGSGYRSMAPELYIGGSWVLKGSNPTIKGRYVYAEAGSGDFEVTMLPSDRAAWIFGASWVWLDNGLADYKVCYDGLICNSERRHAVSFTYIHSW